MRMPPIDKQAHFWAGAAIASTVALYTHPLAGLALAILVAAAKEAWDATGRGTPDVKDFFATVAGATVVAPLML